MKLDVIIPAYNEAEVIAETLQALAEQEVPQDWQLGVVVADDGSTDATVDLAKESSLAPTVLKLGHQGRSAARNQAVAASEADVLLLLGADITLRPGALKAHCLFHMEHPDILTGAVGHVAWDPRVKPTPFMEWMVHGGDQNNFDTLLGEATADPRHFFYASHLSLKRTVLSENTFSEQLTAYGWEDLELGRRLAQQGFKLLPLPSAIGLHHHHYNVEQIRRRQEAAGRSLREYAQLWPEVAVHGRVKQRTAKHQLIRYSGVYALGWKAVSRIAAKRSMPRLFSTVSAWSFWRGYFLQ